MTSRLDGHYTPRLLSIDPGLDNSGWVLFRKGLWAATPVVAVSRIQEWGQIETTTDGSLQARLVSISESVEFVCRRSDAKEVVVEVPSKAGQYARASRGQMDKGVQNLERAIGVIIVGASKVVGHENVRLIRAPSGPWARKQYRHEWLRSVAREAGWTLPAGPRGGKLEDVWDAIWNGVQVLRTPPIANVGRA